MPSTRDIRRRIKSVKNTRQITKAMELVAASKMKRAQQAALAGRHYDGVINVGWAENDDGTRVALDQIAIGSGGSGFNITQTTNNNGPVTIYNEPDGAGGYNAGTAYSPGAPLENTDRLQVLDSPCW